MANPMDLSDFKLAEVINESPHFKTVTLKGTYRGKLTIIRLEKTKFDREQVENALTASDTRSSRDFINDIYQYYTIKPTNLLNDVKAVIITEPSPSIIAKHTRCESIFFTETAEIYRTSVEPFIKSLREKERDRDNWVYNILDGKSEVDRVLMNDPDPETGFMLVSDLKWSGDEDDLHAVALSNRRDITCIRDLGKGDLPLLTNILDKGISTIKNKFKNMKYPIRAFIHYQPTYYHFHVHFRAQNPDDYLTTDRDNPLQVVIDNIKLFDNYYKNATMLYQLAANSSLYIALKEDGTILSN